MEDIKMAYVMVTHWKATEMTGDMMAVANKKFIPMIIATGASSVQAVRTGELSMCIITQYADSDTAKSAQEKIGYIRAQAASEYPMTIVSAHRGEVFGVS
jgi:hypothetical protein